MINHIEEQKRRLIAQSDLQRQAMAAEFQQLTASLAWVPRSVQLVRTVSPLMALVAPIGWVLLRRRSRPKPVPTVATAAAATGLISKIWRGYQIFQQVWPVVQGFRRTRSGL